MDTVGPVLRVIMIAGGLAIALVAVIAVVCYVIHLITEWRKNREEVEYLKQHDVSSDW